MTYPKPLSEKTLRKKYEEAHISGDVREFLHNFFAACANLYGTVDINEIWEIYRELKDDFPRIHKTDLVRFSAIARREKNPYYIYEVEELYSEEPHNDFERQLINSALVRNGYTKLFYFYQLIKSRSSVPFYIPDDLLSYAQGGYTKTDLEFLRFLSGLTSSAETCTYGLGKSIPNVNRGKKLGEFSFLNALERYYLEYYEKKPSMAETFMKNASVTEAEKILNDIILFNNIGHVPVGTQLRIVVSELEEAGVQFTKKQLTTFLKLFLKHNNESRLWCLCGHTPVELNSMYEPGLPKSMTFGPGMQKAFSDGSVDKDAVFAKLREMGIEIVE